jgi:hypothetical protein
MRDTDFETPTFGDAQDQVILMHRDAHFGGNFNVMLDYYLKGGKGIAPDISQERIAWLAEEEKRLGHNLAAQLLSAQDAEEIKKARKAYKHLRDLCTLESPKTPYPLLIANLILSEDETPEKEMQAIVQEKKAIVPMLIDLLRSEEMYNPIYPGYGQAPYYAARCLGQIGDERALISLFESIGKGDFFDDDIALNALKSIGEPAKKFLLKVLHGRPINEDNERAAIALLAFKEDLDVAQAFFNLLKQLDLKKDAFLATYLILGSEGLKGSTQQKEFEDFSQQPGIPKDLKNDFNTVLKIWKS